MWKIIRGNYRKQWFGFIVVMLFVLIASLMLSLAITIATESQGYYDAKAEEANLADGSFRFTQKLDNTGWGDELKLKLMTSDPLIDAYEIEERVTVDAGTSMIQLAPLREDDKISVPNIQVELKNVKHPIYLSMIYKNQGMKIGQQYKLFSYGYERTFTVAGFYENLDQPWNYHGYIKQGEFLEFKKDIAGLKELPPNYNGNKYGLYYMVEAISNSPDFVSIYTDRVLNKYIPQLAALGLSINLSSFNASAGRESMMTFSSILSAALIAFAFLMIIISFIIMRFSIVAFIEDEIKPIGILKSLGYTNKELRLSLIAQYSIVIMVGTIIGILLSLVFTPLVSGLIANTIHVAWAAAPGAGAIFAALMIPIALSLGILWLLSRRIGRITPLDALRQGISTHTFKHNAMPLAKCDKCVNVTVSCKGILNQIKRYVSVGVVVCLISFLAVFATMLHYNLNVNNTAFVSLMGYEKSEIMLYDKLASDNEWISEEKLLAMPEVDKLSYSTHFIYNKVSRGELWMSGQGVFVKDFDMSTIDVLYKGKYPSGANEIIVSRQIAERLDLSIGDTMIVDLTNFDGKKAEMTVTGLCQNMQMSDVWYASGAAIPTLWDTDSADDFTFDKCFVYLKDGADSSAFFAKLQSMVDPGYRHYIGYVADEVNRFVSQTVRDGAMALTIGMDVIAALAVLMVLTLILRLKIIRERRGIAIMKAHGATTWNIIIQVTFGISVLVGLFALIGGLLGALLAGELLKLALMSYGIMTISLVIPWGVVFGLIIGIAGFAFAVSVAIASMTRRITPRSLIARG